MAPSAHRDESIVGQVRSANLLVTVFGSESGQDFAGLSPVIETGATQT